MIIKYISIIIFSISMQIYDENIYDMLYIVFYIYIKKKNFTLKVWWLLFFRGSAPWLIRCKGSKPCSRPEFRSG